jgi:hypothetical protein
MLPAKPLVMLMSYRMWRTLARKRPLILIALIFLFEIAVYLVLTRPLETLVRPLAGYARVVGVLAPKLIHVHALMVADHYLSCRIRNGDGGFMAHMSYNVSRVLCGKHFRRVLLSLNSSHTLFFLRRVDLLTRLRAAEGFGYPPRFDTFHNFVGNGVLFAGACVG